MMQIPIQYFLLVGALLFAGGLTIVLIKKNAVFVLMGIELMLNAANLNLVVFSRFDPRMEGQMMAIFTVVLAAAEATIALAVLLNIFKLNQTTDLDELRELGH